VRQGWATYLREIEMMDHRDGIRHCLDDKGRLLRKIVSKARHHVRNSNNPIVRWNFGRQQITSPFLIALAPGFEQVGMLRSFQLLMIKERIELLQSKFTADSVSSVCVYVKDWIPVSMIPLGAFEDICSRCICCFSGSTSRWKIFASVGHQQRRRAKRES